MAIILVIIGGYCFMAISGYYIVGIGGYLWLF
jgi:hypothetical protein